MKFPLEVTDINDLLIQCANMDNNTPWCRHLTIDEIIKEVFTYANEIDAEYCCMAFSYEESCEESPLIILLTWCSTYGFEADLIIQYRCSTFYDIDLKDIPMKRYGTYDLPDFERIVEKGIDIFNKEFDIDEYEEQYTVR